MVLLKNRSRSIPEKIALPKSSFGWVLNPNLHFPILHIVHYSTIVFTICKRATIDMAHFYMRHDTLEKVFFVFDSEIFSIIQ